MFESGTIYITVEPDGAGDFEITYSSHEPNPNPMCQCLRTIWGEKSVIKLYGINVHLGDVDFEELDMTYWRVLTMIRYRNLA